MTNQGAIREDRLVFPIPPGTHWKEVEAVALPTSQAPALPAHARAPRAERKPKPQQPSAAPVTGRRLRFDKKLDIV